MNCHSWVLLRSSRKKIEGILMVLFVFEIRCHNMPGVRAWSWGKGNEERSSQGHTEEGTLPCSSPQGETQPKWNNFWGWLVEATSSESHHHVKNHKKQTSLQIETQHTWHANCPQCKATHDWNREIRNGKETGLGPCLTLEYFHFP